MIREYFRELKDFDFEVLFIICYATLALLFSIFVPFTAVVFKQEYLLERIIVLGLIFWATPAIPFFLFKNRLKDYGISLGIPRIWSKDLLFFSGIMLVVLIIAFKFTHLRHFYPLYYKFTAGFGNILIYQLAQLFHVSGWEFFFRGFMLFGLAKKIDGRLSVLIQTVPFALMHFGKSPIEAGGSLVAGIFLGIMALRGKSFLPCAILHYLVILAADVLGTLF